MKIGFVATAHYSDEYRPQGDMLINRFIKSIKDVCVYDFVIYIIDNGSTKPLSIDLSEVTYLKIEDQTIEGITGAWNTGIYMAYKDNCDIIINCGDDLWFNETINILLNYMINNYDINAIYSGLTDGVSNNSFQKSNGPQKGIQYCKKPSNILNGFCFAMTRQHYEKFKFKPEKYFNINNKFNGGDGKWGGQEGQFIENLEKGLYGVIINECFISHTKIRGWTQLVGK